MNNPKHTRSTVPEGVARIRNAATGEVIDRRPSCYGCGEQADWLAPDGRCGDCTRLTPEEVVGDE